MISIALRMWLHDRGKLAITLLGVAFAVTLVFVQVGLFRGLLRNATVTIDQAHADLWITSKNTPNVDFPHYFSDAAVARVRGAPGVERADNLLVAFVGMALPNGAEETIVVYGLEQPKVWRLPWAIHTGNIDSLRQGRTMFLDESAARRFGPFAVGDKREVFGRRLDIVGKTRDARSFTTMPIAFTSFDVAQGLSGNLFGGRTAYVLVKVAPLADPSRVAAELRRRLPHNDVYTRNQWARRTRDYWVASTGLGLNVAFAVVLGIVVGITVVAQTLYGFTLDHTRELGTIKAMGGSNRELWLLVATQAVASGVVGYLLALPCVAALGAAARSAGLDCVFGASLAIAIFAGAIALCVLASFVTFRKIASIDPAMAFRA